MNFDIKKFTTIRILSPQVLKSRDWYRSFFNLDPIVDTPNFISFKVAGVSFDITSADTNNPFSSGGSIG